MYIIYFRNFDIYTFPVRLDKHVERVLGCAFPRWDRRNDGDRYARGPLDLCTEKAESREI